MIIHKNGYWEGVEAQEQHFYDACLCDSLIQFFKKENASTLVDFGCGMGKYVKTFREHNLNMIGFDGNPNTPELSNHLCKVLDLSLPIQMEPFDWVMSLEVADHLPPEFEDIYIQNLHKNNKRGIVLSWAIEGQGGDGYVNLRNNDYVKAKMRALGYKNDAESEQKLRDDSSLIWFKKTIMVFRKLF